MTCNLFYYVTKSITMVSFKKAVQKNTILSIETVNVSGVLCKCGHTVAVLCEFSPRESLRAAGFHHRDYQHHRLVCSTWVCLCVSLCVPYCNYWALFMKHKQNQSVHIVALCENRCYVNGAVYVGCNLRTIHTQKLVLPSIFCLFCALWYTQRACESNWVYSSVLNRCNSRFCCAVTLSRARARAPSSSLNASLVSTDTRVGVHICTACFCIKCWFFLAPKPRRGILHKSFPFSLSNSL